jgi:hypothetical protein
MIKRCALMLVCLAAAAELATAQDVVGSSLVEGKQVQLMSDFTWRYIGSRVDDCTAIENDISFCDLTGAWKQTSSGPNSDNRTTFRKNDRTFGIFIVEAVGSADGMTAETMRSLVIGNAARAAGVQVTDVPVLSVSAATIDGHDATTVAYAGKVDSLNFVFLNTIVTQPKRSIQVVTYGVGTELTDEMTQDHRQFLQATQFK